ncbi:MAG: MaoC family dehydratase N-terminal domain-containing protein [Zhengella sp.]|uniref:FAS1-like dehydratase domain-containing protein n=1 Tax=Zhengella sp. TaxID=2282762 RepID=UPI0035292570
MSGMGEALSSWIGRSETRTDIMSADVLTRLAATLDHDRARVQDGDIAVPLAHWLHFLPDTRQSGLGADGHPERGGFLPPVHHLPRRMWAGSRLTFPGDIRAGMTVERVSTITNVKEKTGSAGDLVFVTVRHAFSEPGGPVLVTDEHDIVYRSMAGPAVTPAPSAPPPGTWSRSLVPDAVLLFRYSALTFNGHRIHYDRDYVTREEGYPGLVVHGPLTATLLIDLVGRELPGARISAFSFRARSPLFDGNRMVLNGEPPDAEGRIRLWATNHEGGLAMEAEATVSG